ncbi:hypothetical protein OIDMADRAFT_43379 [Oidiodendron maius Zn]|uniref:Uncharacterized protein n=1 Tax=Oidiodendron maius (strain Zn) TaxID=913774 RepID=A0A0C3H7G0_OIDMZ|nr:hypothetical protein OIDMADRAFT_43379 [Oidiodendron maius Zn]
MSAPSPESDAAWNSLIPSGRGFVLVEDPEKYHLKPGLPTEVGPDRYSVSMFHQLHCLGILRESYYSALHSTKPKIFGEDKLSGELLKHAHSEHVGHCFDYLRQAIMCAADLSLEWAGQTASGTPLATVDGWGIPHKCRSWDQAFEWTLEHRAPHNYTGIA